MRIGVLPLGRGTFDIEFAEEILTGMQTDLDASGYEILGPRALLLDGSAAAGACADLQGQPLDLLLILQVTFTDAAATVAAANAFPDTPLAIWAAPEPRLGGRLRLNAFCGLNLASHALGLAGREFGWLYAAPSANPSAKRDANPSASSAKWDASSANPSANAALAAPNAALMQLLNGGRLSGDLASHPAASTEAGAQIAAALNGKRIGRIGAHPDGFDTCAYDPDALTALTGAQVDAMSLDTLFDRARSADAADANHLKNSLNLDGLDAVDPTELDRSLRLKLALDGLRADGGYDAFAIRCWPETFTEYGGAVCGPVSMLGDARIPCACEADVYGALTQLLMQQAADSAVFLVDLVDMDIDDDTSVVWHCGQAPLSMADPEIAPTATIHTNRKMPLLYQFPLKPGRVTFARLSQAKGAPKLILAGGEMLRRPMAFTGTSGVVRFDRPAGDVLTDVIASGLEHHMGLVYGDHRAVLRGAAGALGLEVIEL